MSVLLKPQRLRSAAEDFRSDLGLIQYLQPLSFSQGTVVVRAAEVLTHLGRPLFRAVPVTTLRMNALFEGKAKSFCVCFSLGVFWRHRPHPSAPTHESAAFAADDAAPVA
jgi:hypothetical protein